MSVYPPEGSTTKPWKTISGPWLSSGKWETEHWRKLYLLTSGVCLIANVQSWFYTMGKECGSFIRGGLSQKGPFLSHGFGSPMYSVPMVILVPPRLPTHRYRSKCFMRGGERSGKAPLLTYAAGTSPVRARYLTFGRRRVIANRITTRSRPVTRNAPRALRSSAMALLLSCMKDMSPPA